MSTSEETKNVRFTGIFFYRLPGRNAMRTYNEKRDGANDGDVPAAVAEAAVMAGKAEYTDDPLSSASFNDLQKMAYDVGIDVASLTGTGPNARLLKADIRDAIKAKQAENE